jgi:hypothetical protein
MFLLGLLTVGGAGRQMGKLRLLSGPQTVFTAFLEGRSVGGCRGAALA